MSLMDTLRPSVRQRLAAMQERIEVVNAMLSSQEAGRNPALLRELTREHADISAVLTLLAVHSQAERDLEAAMQMLAETTVEDTETRDFARQEEQAARERMQTIMSDVERRLLPRDPDDSRNAIIEIRAGTGGDESALFAGELLRMYLRHAERHGWKTELMSGSDSALGGYREVIVRLEGSDVFGRMKYESGGHRVQRVPVTEAQGRIHTSACTVAVMAEADEAGDVTVDPGELRIDVYRASGAGGQHVNKTESAVRITHLPTGLVAECQDERSQHRNRDKAMKVLLTRIRDMREREAHAREAAHRKTLIGSGDRSERIRTYNFPQGRVTEHRINLTLYRLQAIIDGDLDELTDALLAAQAAAQMAALGEGH